MAILRRATFPALAVALACENAVTIGNQITVEDLTGTYVATTFTVTQSGTTEDLLGRGASLTMTLNANRTTSGQLFVPGGNEDGSDLVADLAGTWVLAGSRVSFDHATDTFVRDMPFIADGVRLTGEATFSGATLRVVLTRQ